MIVKKSVGKKNSKNDYLAWDISTPFISSLKNNNSKRLDEIPTHLFKPYLTFSENNQHKNIPLKDVPMNDLVKKMQKEFELEEGKNEIDHIWNR